MANDKWTIRQGFTLIELLVVISIIGILATLVTANLNAARSRARDAQRKSDLRNTATALRLYFNDYGSYPKNGGTYNISDVLGCGTNGASACGSSLPWSAGSGPTTYMSSFPKDPLPSQYYKYIYVGTDSYTLQACLENKSDANGLVATVDWCPSAWMFQIQP